MQSLLKSNEAKYMISKEDTMFVITEKAAVKIKDILGKQQGPGAIRILSQPG
jgi:predicted RNA-binding protein